MNKKDIAKTFEEYTIPVTESGCLIWTGATHRTGYGIIRRNNKLFMAHRWIWEFHHGKIADGLCVCHKCDVRPCVNVNHLFLGTRAENTQDRDRKGRTARGEKAGNALFMDAEIREIRRLYHEIKALQAKLRAFKKRGCSKNFTEITHNRLWKHIN